MDDSDIATKYDLRELTDQISDLSQLKDQVAELAQLKDQVVDLSQKLASLSQRFEELDSKYLAKDWGSLRGLLQDNDSSFASYVLSDNSALSSKFQYLESMVNLALNKP